VVAAARESERLRGLLVRGADAIVAVDGGGDLTAAIREAAGGDVHVTIDTLWGEPAVAAMGAAARGARHVQVGQIADVDVQLPAPAVRSVSLDLCGFSVAHPPIDVRREGYLGLTTHAARGDVAVDVERVPLDRVEAAWERQREATGGAKQVLVPTTSDQERSPVP
jgi:NADPH2:quinone reductase